MLVGNAGDGRIGVYQGDRFAGLLRGASGRPVAIDGLKALVQGTVTIGGTNSVVFGAGPRAGAHGLIGKLVAG